MAPVVGLPNCQKCRPAVNSGPYTRVANCWQRAYSVSMPEARGEDWMIPAFGFASIRRTRAAQTLTGHHRVSVQHNHIAILAAPAAAEVIDVAALTLHSTTTAAVEDLPFALHFGNQLHPRLLLSNTDIGVIAIAEDIDVEMSGVTGRFHRLPRSPAGRRKRGQRLRYRSALSAPYGAPGSTVRHRPSRRKYCTYRGRSIAAGSPLTRSRSRRKPSRTAPRRGSEYRSATRTAAAA